MSCVTLYCVTPRSPLRLTLAPRASIRNSSDDSVGYDYVSLSTVHLTSRPRTTVGLTLCALPGNTFGTLGTSVYTQRTSAIACLADALSLEPKQNGY